MLTKRSICAAIRNRPDGLYFFDGRDGHEAGGEESADPAADHGQRADGVRAAGVRRKLREQHLRGPGRVQGHDLPLFRQQGRAVPQLRSGVLSAADGASAGSRARPGVPGAEAAGGLLRPQDGLLPHAPGVPAHLLRGGDQSAAGAAGSHPGLPSGLRPAECRHSGGHAEAPAPARGHGPGGRGGGDTAAAGFHQRPLPHDAHAPRGVPRQGRKLPPGAGHPAV